MSATIRTTCPTCGPVMLGAETIVLQTAEEDAAQAGLEGLWTFRCPCCGEQVTRRANARIARLLTGAGAEVAGGPSATALEQRQWHPEYPPDGPPITWDDLLDMHMVLESPDWFDRLRAITPPGP